MATSGTTSFSLNRDSIIAAALRTLEVIAAGETPTPQDNINCAEALNILVKGMVVEGLPLWCVQEVLVPMVAGQGTYQLGPATSNPRPLRILQAYLRNSTGNDVELTIVSRSDYNTLGMKAQQAVPNQLFYDPQLTNGNITVYNVPQDATSVIHCVIQRQIQDFNLATDNPDFPQEAFQMLKWSLVDELAMEYGASITTIQLAAAKAKVYRDALMNFEQEQVSTFFYPSGRKY